MKLMTNSISTQKNLMSEYRLTFLCGLLFGLAAYMYAITNKFVNPDELEYLFSKGATLDSGRWFLALTSAVFPDISMPWINGVISVTLLSTACCVIIHTFEIKSRLLQVLLAAVIVTFPAETLTMTYMFTVAPYALTFLFFSLSVYELTRGGKARCGVSVLLFCLGCAVYQAYLSLAASLFVVYIIIKLLKREWTAKDGICFGIKAVAVMLAGVMLYFSLNKLILFVTGTEYNEYASNSMNVELTPRKLLDFVKSAYLSFYYFFRYKYLQYISTKVAQISNALLLVVVFVAMIKSVIKDRDLPRVILTVVLIVILPFAINCIVVFPFVHSLMLYGFISIYVLSAAVLDNEDWSVGRLYLRDLGAICLAVIVMCNLVYSNKIYLKQKLVYEESYGFYTALTSRIKSLPGYSDDDKIALLGDGVEQVYKISEIETTNLISVGDELLSVYSRDKLLRYYMGVGCEIIDETELTQDQLVIAANMPRYPADGGIVRDEGVIIVKLEW